MQTVRRGSARTLLICIAVTLGMIGAGCVPDPGSGGGLNADCTSPPTLGPGALLQGCSLAGLDLSGINLSGAMLAGANLSNSDLSGTDLSGANLEGANLTNADLTGANLARVILSGAILLGALFLNAILDGALFGFGQVFGPGGLGGGEASSGASCVGEYCPGYNSASVNFSAWLCRTGENSGVAAVGFDITRTHDDLLVSGERSVVTDSSTDFSGASFIGEDANFQGLDLREANFENTTWVDAKFVCTSLDGARFAGASMTLQQFHHVSARNADFSGVHVFTSWMCDSDFTDATFSSSTWEGFSGFSCAEFVPEDELDLLPDPLVILDGVDFSNSVMGGVPDPDRGQALLAFTYAFEGRELSASMVGANLNGVTVTDGLFWRADLSGSTADGATFVGQHSGFQNVQFPSTGWENATFTGSPNFDGATCPDGTTGSFVNPCFAVTP